MNKLSASWLLVALVTLGATVDAVDLRKYDTRWLPYSAATITDPLIVNPTILAEYLHVCHREDPKLTECMKESIETLRPYLARGIPELDIPSIDPIHLGDLIVAESVPGQGVSISAKDIKAYGPSNFKLKKLK